MRVHCKGLASISIVILVICHVLSNAATTQTIDVSAHSAILMDEIADGLFMT